MAAPMVAMKSERVTTPVVNAGLPVVFQAACETFDVRGKHRIQIPKLYTSNVTWDPSHYRLVRDSQPLDLNKGARWAWGPCCWDAGVCARGDREDPRNRGSWPQDSRLLSLSRGSREPTEGQDWGACFVSEGACFGRKPWEGDRKGSRCQRRASWVPGTVAGSSPTPLSVSLDTPLVRRAQRSAGLLAGSVGRASDS